MVASFGNCWLEVVEECKRLKREKGTHKKVRDPEALGRKAIVATLRAGLKITVWDLPLSYSPS